MYITMRVIVTVAISLFLLSSCKQDTTVGDDRSVLNIAIKKDPAKLNPIVYPVQTARQVYQYLFTPLADFNPETYELEPILLTSLPEPEVVERGPHAGRIKYVVDIRKGATWADGTPITGADYLFTLKAIKHPETAAGSYRSYLTNLVSAQINPTDKQKVTVIFDEYYFLSKEIVSTLDIYPKHIYDPHGYLDNLPLPVLDDKERYDERAAKDSTLTTFATDFNSVKYSREIVSGSGPYELVDWVTDQVVVLQRKENYWGADSDIPYLQAGPQQLIFHIIPDEVAVINQLKSGEMDLYAGASAAEFTKLRDSDQYGDQFSFLTPEVLRTYFISINNSDPALADVDVRKAIAHLVDVEEIIDLMEKGLAKRATGHININKPMYKQLPLIEEDVEKAESILTADGWADTNADGTIDKHIDGEQVELILDMYTTGSDLSNKIALLLSENAKQVGIKINIIQKKYRDFRRENLAKRDYDLFTSAFTQDLAHDDLYGKWHSDNDTPTGGNTFSYRSEKADELIEKIRDTKNETELLPLYADLQQQIHDDQAVIWLYHPMEKVILSKKWKGSGTVKRPGYLANTFQIR